MNSALYTALLFANFFSQTITGSTVLISSIHRRYFVDFREVSSDFNENLLRYSSNVRQMFVRIEEEIRENSRSPFAKSSWKVRVIFQPS